MTAMFDDIDEGAVLEWVLRIAGVQQLRTDRHRMREAAIDRVPGAALGRTLGVCRKRLR